MKERIETPTVGEMLKEEFLDPLGISAYGLAKHINVPSSRILDILHGKRRITVETGLKLSRYFGMSDRFFIDLQTDIDIRNEKIVLVAELAKIEPAIAG
ncbi:HigA family addiction module antitoxin [Treponema primitia]|uniref:HigA family addiction module antitoxin n=1 Tax=Treponema primitia TaxID=88058 RepID=UPI00397F1BE9